MQDKININEHKFFSLVPFSALKALEPDFDFNIGEKVDIEVIGKGIGRGFRLCGDMGYQLSNDKKSMLIIDLNKAEPYIIIHRLN